MTNGRPGGNRTPNLRFWRPLLCRLSYWPCVRRWCGAHNWNRTSDLSLTKGVLYRLSYVGRIPSRSSARLERVMGIEPTSSAWKAEVLPLNYTREVVRAPSHPQHGRRPCNAHRLVVGGGFEPPKAEPSDLQSDPFDHSGTPPTTKQAIVARPRGRVNGKRHGRRHGAGPSRGRGESIVPPPPSRPLENPVFLIFQIDMT